MHGAIDKTLSINTNAYEIPMSTNKLRLLLILGMFLFSAVGPRLALSTACQEEGEGKAGVQEAVQRIELAKEEMKAATDEMQEAIKDAKAEVVEGDAVVVEGQAIMLNAFGFEPAKIKAAKRFQLVQVFQVEIELIERLCEPTPQQLTKLRVGTKGAVKKLTDAWWKKAGPQFGGMVAPGAPLADENAQDGGGESEGEAAAEEAEAVEITDANQIDSNMANFVLTDQMGNPFKAKLPQHSATWFKLVSSVLTEQQFKVLSEYKAAQEKERRIGLLDSIISQLTRELSLTSEQQTKLREIIQPHIAQAPLNCLPIFELYIGYYYASKPTNEEFSKILSPAQTQSLRMFLLPVQEIGAMMEMEDQNDVEDEE